MLEKMERWLQTFPLWEEGCSLQMDYTGAEPGSNGLYPQGLEELERHEDVLGNVKARCRYRFKLCRVVNAQAGNKENAQWLLSFQQWAQRQSAMGLAPVFGDEPKLEKLWAEKGKLENASQTGTATYAVSMIAEFVKNYEFQEE